MSDFIRSIVRTVVPGAWAMFVLWLANLGWLPQSWIDFLNSSPAVEKVTAVVAFAVAYAFVRWIEPHMPDWLTRILLGSAQPPVYVEPPQR